jgi:hypothetical protein
MNGATFPFPHMISRHGHGNIHFTFLRGKLFVAFKNRRGLVVGLSTLQSADFRFKCRTTNYSILTEVFSGWTQSQYIKSDMK